MSRPDLPGKSPALDIALQRLMFMLEEARNYRRTNSNLAALGVLIALDERYADLVTAIRDFRAGARP